MKAREIPFGPQAVSVQQVEQRLLWPRRRGSTGCTLTACGPKGISRALMYADTALYSRH